MSEDHRPEASPSTSQIGVTGTLLPADAGLSGLGLVMSLAGGLFSVLATGVGALALISFLVAGGRARSDSGAMLVVVLVATASVVRSRAHRAAGERLLYDGPGTPSSALRRYFVIAGLQTAVVMFVAVCYHAPGSLLVGALVVLASWPVALAISLRSGRIPALLAQPAIPRGEDKGFEGAAIVMVILGMTGLLCGVVLALGVLREGVALESAPALGLSMIAIVVMLLVRSSIHLTAGFTGVRHGDLDGTVAAATKYGSVGLGTAIAIGIVFLLVALSSAGANMPAAAILIVLVTMALLIWGLALWPRIIARFYSERQFTLPGDASYVRAPDRGLTTLGWLLFGQAVMSLATSVPVFLLRRMLTDEDIYYRSRDPMVQMLNALQGLGGGQMWPVLMAALQLIVGWQLIHMRPNHKLVATIWAIAATLVAAYMNYPLMKAMAQLGVLRMFGSTGAGGVSFIVVAISLIAPIATLILVRRSQRDLPAATVVAE